MAALHTRVCDLFGVEHPLLNAPMGGGDAPGRLAGAVSEAGGLGMIGGTTAAGVAWVREQVAVARAATSRPFGIGFVSHMPGTDALLDAAIDEGVRIVAHSFADPTPFMDAARRAGVLVICQVRTVAEAVRAAEAGVDAITAQGTEAGGHTGRVSTLPLVPAVVDAVRPIPVIAAGGIADGRALAAALLLGAEGVWVGTRFVAAHESGVTDEHKRRVVAASADDTVLTDVFDVAAGVPWPDDVLGRSIRNAFTDRWHGRPDDLRAWAGEHPDAPAVAYRQGTADDTALYAGEAASQVGSVEPAGDIVRRLVADAAAALRERTAAVVADG